MTQLASYAVLLLVVYAVGRVFAYVATHPLEWKRETELQRSASELGVQDSTRDGPAERAGKGKRNRGPAVVMVPAAPFDGRTEGVALERR